MNRTTYHNTVVNEISKRDKQYRNVQEQLHSDKDSAINSLWQRSILLVSLLVICYTGYGTLFMKLLDDSLTKKYSISIPKNLINNDDKQIDVEFEDTTDYKIWRIHVALSIISFVGCILSMLWILMAKGSKAWQEAHENAISDLEYFNIYKNLPYDGEHGKWSIRMDSYTHGWWQGGYLWLDEKKVSDCIFNTKLACYSPSKINIVIGIVSFVIFTLLCVIHTGMVNDKILSFFCEINWYDVIVAIPIILLLLSVICIIYFVLLNSTESSVLGSKIVKKDSKRDKQRIELTNAIEKVVKNSMKKRVKTKCKNQIDKAS